MLNTYITSTELKSILNNDFTQYSTAELDNFVGLAGNLINSYLGYSLVAETITSEKNYIVRPDDLTASLVVIPNVYQVNTVTTATIYYNGGTTESVDTTKIQILNNSILYIPYTSAIDNSTYVVLSYTHGISTIPNPVKTAAAFIARGIMRQFLSFGDTGENDTGSTLGAKLKKFQNREYSEEYSYGESSKNSVEAEYANSSEMEMAYMMLRPYKRML